MWPVDGVRHWWMGFRILMGWGVELAVVVLLIWATSGQPGRTEDVPD